jgi:membrane-bound lytic murein transglycosylase A
LLVACAPKSLPPKVEDFSIHRADYNSLNDWSDIDNSVSFKAFLQSCATLQNTRKPLSVAHVTIEPEHVKRVCSRAFSVYPVNQVTSKQFFEANFTPYLVTNLIDSVGLFTGYYEPLLHGAQQQYGKYQTPLYRKPKDLMPGKRYLSRAQIKAGALHGKGLELLWVDSPIDAFFLHVQGSGRVKLDTGEIIKVGFAAKNHHPYTAIGKTLIERGELAKEDVSLFTIREWLQSNPSQASEVMQQNASFIFFELKPDSEPIGAPGIPLTPGYSLAIDKRYIPYGLPIFLETTLPTGDAFDRLMIAQDTGSAIKGAVRGDVFFGAGQKAEKLAGTMKQLGRYYVLLPKSAL